MSTTQTRLLTVFAPAKVNLYLHITGRLDNGYHMLDSLISFVDIGDQITIEPSPDFVFEVEGPRGGSFGPKERDSSPHSSNLVVQAVWELAQAAQKVPNIKATLHKHLPLAAGLGGGSSDAAAVIWGLLEWWGLPKTSSYLPGLMSRLGADVPVCLRCNPARVTGIGDILNPVTEMDEIPIVLVNPNKPCPTANVFAHYDGRFKDPVELPESLYKFDELMSFLRKQENDLQSNACAIIPEIENILRQIEGQKNCALSRLSGSGATCYGLFEQEKDAKQAAKKIAEDNPDWWVRAGYLNRPHRY